MFSIDIGGCEIVLGSKWLRTIGPILMDFKDLTMQLQHEGQQYKFQGISTGSPKIISSHHIENLQKKYDSGIISQLHSIHVVGTPYVHPDLQYILPRHHVVFTTPQDLPPSRGVHDHSIPLISGSIPPNIHPYHHPFSQNNEIEKIVHELLEFGVICPNTSPYSSSMVMVLKKEGNWHMCLDLCTLNKLTFKDKLPIPIIDDLLDELSGA
jgi:hypothetical protein